MSAIAARGKSNTTSRSVTSTALTLCKELVFSVDSGDGGDVKRELYATQACLQGERWKWALAEPTVERWGSLQ